MFRCQPGLVGLSYRCQFKMSRFPFGLELRAVDDKSQLGVLVSWMRQSIEPVEHGGLQRDAVVGVTVVGFHVEFGGAGVAGFLQRLEERVIVGG